MNMRNMSRLTRTLVPAAALAALMALAACGGEPTPTPTLPPPGATATPIPPTATPAPPLSTPSAAPRPTSTATPRPEPTPTPVPSAPEPQGPAGPALPASIVDVYGNEIVVDDVSRIVVMNGDVTEVIYALGLGENVVAVDTSATYPSEGYGAPAGRLPEEA